MFGAISRARSGAAAARRLVGACVLLLLAGCEAVSTSQAPVSTDLDSSHGVAVIGMAIANNPRNALGFSFGIRALWMRYDPATGKRIGDALYETNTGSGILMMSAVDSGKVGYFSLRLPPGDYSLAELRFARDKEKIEPLDYLLVHGTLYTVYQGAGDSDPEISQRLLPDARLIAMTPHFHVDANMMVYVGDLHFDVGQTPTMKRSLTEDEDAARKFAASAGPDAAGKMLVQPLIRGDGKPIGNPDETHPVVVLERKPVL